MPGKHGEHFRQNQQHRQQPHITQGAAVQSSVHDPYRGILILGYCRVWRLVWWILGFALVVYLIVIMCTGMTNRMFYIRPDWHMGKLDPHLDFAAIANPNMTSAGRWSRFKGPARDVNRLVFWEFLLRMVPIALAAQTILMSIDFSHYHLYAQPLVNLYQGPSLAQDTILLDYMTRSSLAALLQAWDLCHHKVFYFAIVELMGPVINLIPVGLLSLTSRDGIIYGRFSPGFVIATIVAMTVYLLSYVVGFFSIKQRFPRWQTSLIDIWALCFSSHLARYPEFSECGPGWTKKDLEASLQLRNNRYMLGLITGADGLQRVGFDVATVGRQQVSSGQGTVLYVSPGSKTASHCHRCVADEDYHRRPEVKEREELLQRQYRDWHDPVALSRGFSTSRRQPNGTIASSVAMGGAPGSSGNAVPVQEGIAVHGNYSGAHDTDET